MPDHLNAGTIDDFVTRELNYAKEPVNEPNPHRNRDRRRIGHRGGHHADLGESR
jgi:hypothetical protein